MESRGGPHLSRSTRDPLFFLQMKFQTNLFSLWSEIQDYSDTSNHRNSLDIETSAFFRGESDLPLKNMFCSMISNSALKKISRGWAILPIPLHINSVSGNLQSILKVWTRGKKRIYFWGKRRQTNVISKDLIVESNKYGFPCLLGNDHWNLHKIILLTHTYQINFILLPTET